MEIFLCHVGNYPILVQTLFPPAAFVPFPSKLNIKFQKLWHGIFKWNPYSDEGCTSMHALITWYSCEFANKVKQRNLHKQVYL